MSKQPIRRRRRSSQAVNTVRLSQTQRWALFVLVLPILWLMVLAWQQMSSALYDYQTQRWLDYWSETSSKRKVFLIAENDYQAALNGAQKALLKQPRKAEYMRNLARVYDWYLISGRRDKPEYAEAKTQALVYFRAAAQARPVWPLGWYDLALAKARQRELDDEFDVAVINAVTLGPWEEQVQAGVAYLGFVLFSFVEPDVQLAMQGNWQRMAQHQPGLMLKLALESDRVALACRYFIAPLPRQCAALKKKQ